ncbi:AraC family transcriptional regulator [Rhodanobacter sp. IGA1.0]|uniref:AraC family transcriptional regulator n=1 Tax=Rhodanobacter sp. IGA1.0 TaxID=3158582 RepID=A0AAU7QL91_9GAMM
MGASRLTVLFDSPLLRITDIDCSHPRGGCGCERGDERTHLVLLRRGGFGYHLRGAEYVGDPATALLYRAGDSYRISHPFEGGDAGSGFEVAPAHEEALFGRRLRGSADAARPVEAIDQYRHRALHAALARGERDSLRVEEAAAGLCTAVLGHDAATSLASLSPSTRRRLGRVQQVLLADPTSAVGLADLATHAGCSPFHLSRLFRRACGSSLVAYRTRLRIALALDRLAHGADNLAALASELGFSHQSHFGATFRRHVGLTPRVARETLRPPTLVRTGKNLIAAHRPES